MEYQLKQGEKVTVVRRDGTTLGNSYMHRVFLSLQVERADGTRVALDQHTPYWICNRGYWACHYKSGMSKADSVAYLAAYAELENRALKFNETRIVVN